MRMDTFRCEYVDHNGVHVRPKRSMKSQSPLVAFDCGRQFRLPSFLFAAAAAGRCVVAVFLRTFWHLRHGAN